jgi:short-subunit dehydrogenase involved in D-alanine esterification of teichoic acids
VADVTSKEQVDRMVAEAAQQLGGLHILVNSGSSPGGSATATGPIDTVVDEDLIQDFNVKYVGALRCSRAVIPFMKTAGWGRIINISGANARNAGNLSGGARNASLVHMTKTLAVQMGRHGITVNCIHPGTTRTERTPSLLAARATQLGVSPEEAERQDFAPDSPRGNAICRMVDASEVAIRHGLPGLGQGLGGLRRAGRGNRRSRAVGAITEPFRRHGGRTLRLVDAVRFRRLGCRSRSPRRPESNDSRGRPGLPTSHWAPPCCAGTTRWPPQAHRRLSRRLGRGGRDHWPRA